MEISEDKKILYPQKEETRIQIPTDSNIKTKKSCFYDRARDRKFMKFLEEAR